METLDKLFNQVKEIEEQFKSKETFNAFRSIGVWNQERMHSQFIAEMLNPKGSHKMNTSFLKLFLKRIDYNHFNPVGARVAVEERSETRWIDLIIETAQKDAVIVVENKLYAKDQNRQLADYYKFCKGKYPTVKMVYLTLDGKKPTLESIGEQDHGSLKMDDILCISYEKQIVPWIDECANMAGLPVRVKGALEMYSELVTNLINKNKYMDAIFNELKTDKEKLKLALDINKSLEGRNYLKEFPEIRSLLEDIILNLDDDTIEDQYFDDNDSEVYFKLKDSGDNWWSLRFEIEREVYFIDDDSSEKAMTLFWPSDINNPLLKSLLLEDRDTAYQIIGEKLVELQKRSYISIKQTPN